MPYRNIKLVVTRALPKPVEVRLMELFDTTLNPADTPMERDDLAKAVSEANVLLPTVTDIIDQRILARAGDRLKLIASFGAGVDHIDLATARQRNIIVTNTPGVLTEDTADMTMALILAAPRQLMRGIQMLRDNLWKGWSPTGLLGSRVHGKRLGIIGMGKIGQAVARRARAFGLEIHYHNRKRLPPNVTEPLGASYWESVDQMLAHMDIVSIHCPHTPATYHLLSARRLKLMKPDAYVINTARGEIIDENAMTRMLERGELAGAALDVFEREPLINSRLRALDNVLLLPHMASSTRESRQEMGELAIRNILAFAQGKAPPNRLPSAPD